MTQFYNAKRVRNLFDPQSKEPFNLSRSKIELFIECPRCFYLDRRLGIGRPGGFPFTLNKAVDALLKKEFDIHRAKGRAHPLMKAYKIEAIPFAHEKMGDWRENFKGIQFLHRPTNLIITGAVDDIWINGKQKLHVVDYKATSTGEEITLDDEWKRSYKRQMEVYQWLLRRNDFKVSDIGYFVYVNAQSDKEAFDAKLEFEVKIIEYTGSDEWVEKAIFDAHECLTSDILPEMGKDCDFCAYREAVKEYEN